MASPVQDFGLTTDARSPAVQVDVEAVGGTARRVPIEWKVTRLNRSPEVKSYEGGILHTQRRSEKVALYLRISQHITVESYHHATKKT